MIKLNHRLFLCHELVGSVIKTCIDRFSYYITNVFAIMICHCTVKIKNFLLVHYLHIYLRPFEIFPLYLYFICSDDLIIYLNRR